MDRDKSLILDDVQQPDANTCQSAAIARVIGETDVHRVRAALQRIARCRGTAAGDPWVMGDFLKARVQQYKFLEKGSLNDLRGALDQGFHAITHGWFSPFGHVIGVSGWGHVGTDGQWRLRQPDPDNGWVYFKSEDPWFEFDFGAGRFTNRHGDDVPYSAFGLYAYCVAGWSYAQAREIYARGVLDSGKGGAWLHLVKN